MNFAKPYALWNLKSVTKFESCADLERWRAGSEGMQTRASPAKSKRKSLSLHIKFNKNLPRNPHTPHPGPE